MHLPINMLLTGQVLVMSANKEQIGLLQATVGIVSLYGNYPAVFINTLSAYRRSELNNNCPNYCENYNHIVWKPVFLWLSSELVRTVGFVAFTGVRTKQYCRWWLGLASVSTACVYGTCSNCDTLPFFSALLIPDVTWQPESLSVSPESGAYMGQYAWSGGSIGSRWKVIQGPTWQLPQLCW